MSLTLKIEQCELYLNVLNSKDFDFNQVYVSHLLGKGYENYIIDPESSEFSTSLVAQISF